MAKKHSFKRILYSMFSDFKQFCLSVCLWVGCSDRNEMWRNWNATVWQLWCY